MQEFIEIASYLFEITWIILNSRNYSDEFQEVIIHELYLAHVIEQPIFRIPNILFVYLFIDFFVKHIFLRHV